MNSSNVKYCNQHSNLQTILLYVKHCTLEIEGPSTTSSRNSFTFVKLQMKGIFSQTAWDNNHEKWTCWKNAAFDFVGQYLTLKCKQTPIGHLQSPAEFWGCTVCLPAAASSVHISRTIWFAALLRLFCFLSFSIAYRDWVRIVIVNKLLE